MFAHRLNKLYLIFLLFQNVFVLGSRRTPISWNNWIILPASRMNSLTPVYNANYTYNYNNRKLTFSEFQNATVDNQIRDTAFTKRQPLEKLISSEENVETKKEIQELSKFIVDWYQKFKVLKHTLQDLFHADDGNPFEGRKKKSKKGKLKYVKVKRSYKKYMMPLLMAYKLKFFTLIPVMLGGLVLLAGSTGMAGFFFALFASVMSLKSTGYHRHHH